MTKELLSSKRLTALKNVQSLDPNFHLAGAVGEFIGFYLLCEVLATKLQNYYRADNNKPELDKIQIQALTASLKYFSLTFDNSELKSVFSGGKGLVGKKSARQLRNGYLHSLSATDKQEIINKAPHYNESMKKFLGLLWAKYNRVAGGL